VANSTIEALFDSLSEQRPDKLPPVHLWHPDRSAEIDIRIAADGTWYHEGRPIRRHEIVRLFSTILRRDDDGIVLVTPAERLMIEVEIAPFMVIDMAHQGEGANLQLAFVTNMDEVVPADADHRLMLDDSSGEVTPLLDIRDGLQGLLTRPLYYRLIDLALVHGEVIDDYLWITSCGEQFNLGATQ
jgi:hypothetical protein